MLFDLNYKLNSGERLVGIARKHWFMIVSKLFGSLIIISLLIFFVNKFSDAREGFAVTVILLACFIIYFIYIWIMQRVNYFVITSDRIIRIKQRGVWDRDINEISISDIGNITLNVKGIAATFFKFGSVKIVLKNSLLFNITNIANPTKVYQGLIKLKEIKKA